MGEISVYYTSCQLRQILQRFEHETCAKIMTGEVNDIKRELCCKHGNSTFNNVIS